MFDYLLYFNYNNHLSILLKFIDIYFIICYTLHKEPIVVVCLYAPESASYF